MIRYFFKAISIMAFTGFIAAQTFAQQGEGKEKVSENDEIIIKKKGDVDVKVTVEIKDGEVKVNGKTLSEFDDDNVTIRRRRSVDGQGRLFTPPASPFRGGTWNFNENDELARSFSSETNRPLLGVMSSKEENGAKITGVTKGSAAEKAGLKEGDIITRVDEMKIENPEDLTKAVGKFKPEEKATITYKRDKKEYKATATLGKRTGATTMFPENFDFRNNLDLAAPGQDGFNYIMRGGNPRLGIKAQDTEDGKGVKVLEVGEESHAEKAGIKEGDVIMEFDSKSVNTAGELADAAKNAKDKNSIRVKLLREGKTQEVEIKVPKKLKTTSL